MNPASGLPPSGEGWRVETGNTFHHAIADLWVRQTDDDVSIGIFCDERHENGNAAMHGGVICTLADIGLGKLVELRRNPDQRPDQPRIISATIQLDVSFCGQIVMGDFVHSKATISSMTRSMTFAQGELFVGERVVAIMQGVFKVVANRRA
ncbi:MAG: PaaI family thioesterase [Nitratireductor sp.]|nr:PaaI family thioesterase [Nitratireductor sp.]